MDESKKLNASPMGSIAHYRSAVAEAEKIFGPDSPIVGLQLMDLADCLEERGLTEEAEKIAARYRAIIVSELRRQGLIIELF